MNLKRPKGTYVIMGRGTDHRDSWEEKWNNHHRFSFIEQEKYIPADIMGKKRSKTQKKKQVKASNKLAKAFAKKLGVATSTGGVTSPSNGENMNLDIDRSGTVSDGKPQKKPIINSKRLLVKLTKKQQRNNEEHMDAPNVRGSCDGGKVEGNVQLQDFVKEANSLRERELQIEWKRNVMRENRRLRHKGGKLELTPASFSLALGSKKSVEQLVGKVSTIGLDESRRVEDAIAGSSTASRTTTPTKLQALPTPFSTPKSFLSWNDQDDNSTGGEDVRNENPWAVLDEEEVNERESPEQPLSTPAQASFQFAPASFAVSTDPQQPSHSNIFQNPKLAPQPNANFTTEIDPDL